MKSRVTSSGCESGMSLIEVLVAVSVLAIVGMGMMTMLTNVSKENRALVEKLDAINLQQQLLKTLSVGEFCGCLLNGRRVNTTSSSATLSIARIPDRYSGTCSAGSGSLVRSGRTVAGTRLTVDSIALDNVRSVMSSAGIYSGEVTLSFRRSGLVRPIKPINFSIQLQLDMTNPPNSRRIMACGTVGADDLDQVARGLANIPPTRDNGTWVVNLPPGKFTAPPLIFLQSRWQIYSGSESVSFWVTNVTRSSFTINSHGPSGSSYPIQGQSGIYWTAFPQP